MEKREVVRLYHFADATLITIANEKDTFAHRDITEVTTMGVDAAYLTAFETDITGFENLPTDEELEGAQIIATEEKDAAAEEVRESVRDILTRVENKWGVNSGRYRKYGTKALSQMSDDKLLVCGRRVSRVATTDLAALASEGLTAAIITDLDTKCQTFEDAINTQRNAIADRDIATEDRIEAGNSIFTKVKRICNAGQSIWHDVDEAKFNDYIIYNTPSGGPIPLTGTVPAGTTGNVVNRTFAEQDTIEAENTGPEKWEISLSNSPTTAGGTVINVDPGTTQTFFASDLGDVTLNTFLNIKNIGSQTAQYSIIIAEG